MRIINEKEFLNGLTERRKRVIHAQRIGVASGANIVANVAKDNAPYVTGTLKRSIHVEPTDLAQIKGNEVYADVGSPEPYAARIEYGFNDTDSIGRSYNQSPQPYLRPAIDDNKEKFKKEVAAAIKQVWQK